MEQIHFLLWSTIGIHPLNNSFCFINNVGGGYHFCCQFLKESHCTMISNFDWAIPSLKSYLSIFHFTFTFQCFVIGGGSLTYEHQVPADNYYCNLDDYSPHHNWFVQYNDTAHCMPGRFEAELVNGINIIRS